MTPIADMDTYTAGMRKSIQDKLWFIDKVADKVDSVVDYGCADGALLYEIHNICPSIRLYGYDNNVEMLQRASTLCPFATYSQRTIKAPDSKSLLVVSSVFHEIYSYSTDIKAECASIFNSGYRYIAIRDMFYTKAAVRKADGYKISSVLRKEPQSKIQDFERFHGPITENVNFLHYLLKYRYTENWEREVKENYFPQSLEEFLSNIPQEYKIASVQPYTLPFTRTKIHRDFGFWLEDTTHAQILLEKV